MFFPSLFKILLSNYDLNVYRHLIVKFFSHLIKKNNEDRGLIHHKTEKTKQLSFRKPIELITNKKFLKGMM